nr:hypothetical protein CFP56_07606 [Quercus suber]
MIACEFDGYLDSSTADGLNFKFKVLIIAGVYKVSLWQDARNAVSSKIAWSWNTYSTRLPCSCSSDLETCRALEFVMYCIYVSAPALALGASVDHDNGHLPETGCTATVRRVSGLNCINCETVSVLCTSGNARQERCDSCIPLVSLCVSLCVWYSPSARSRSKHFTVHGKRVSSDRGNRDDGGDRR